MDRPEPTYSTERTYYLQGGKGSPYVTYREGSASIRIFPRLDRMLLHGTAEITGLIDILTGLLPLVEAAEHTPKDEEA